jgi:hypothetical protein
MLYFFHHYELPVILQQAQLQDILMRNQVSSELQCHLKLEKQFLILFIIVRRLIFQLIIAFAIK